METALTLIRYFITQFINQIFSMYLFDGVSIGMLFVVFTIFNILIRYTISVPRTNSIKGGSIHERRIKNEARQS